MVSKLTQYPKVAKYLEIFCESHIMKYKEYIYIYYMAYDIMILNP